MFLIKTKKGILPSWDSEERINHYPNKYNILVLSGQFLELLINIKKSVTFSIVVDLHYSIW